MFKDEIARALAATPRGRLCALAATLWKGYAAGVIDERDAQELAEAIETRKVVPSVKPERRRVGSRPRSPESMERRRRWSAQGWLPPQLAARFTLAENAVLAVIATEIARRGVCRWTLNHIAALAGVCRKTAKTAIREAASLNLLRSEEWRLSAFRSAPNTVTILSPEWLAWLRLRSRKGGGKFLAPTKYHLETKGSDGERKSLVAKRPDDAMTKRRRRENATGPKHEWT